MGNVHSCMPEEIDTQIRNTFDEYFNDGSEHLATPDQVKINENLRANEEYSWQMTEDREKLWTLPVVMIDKLSQFFIKEKANILSKMRFDKNAAYFMNNSDEYCPGNMWIISPECFKYILLYIFDKGPTLNRYAQDSFEMSVLSMMIEITSYNFLYKSILYEVGSVLFEKFKFCETYEQKVESSHRIVAYINGFQIDNDCYTTGKISYSKAELDIYTQYRQKMTKDLIFLLEKNEILAGAYSLESYSEGKLFSLMIPFATYEEHQEIKKCGAKLEITQIIYKHTQAFLKSNDEFKIWKWRYFNYFSCNSIYPTIVIKAFEDFYKEKEFQQKEELQDASFYSKSLLQYYPIPLLGNFKPEILKFDDNNKSTQILNLDAIYAKKEMEMSPSKFYLNPNEYAEMETRISYDLLIEFFQINGSQFDDADWTWIELLRLLGKFFTRLKPILYQEEERGSLHDLITLAGWISESLYEMFPQEHSSHEGERLFLLLIGWKRGGHHSQINYFKQAWELLKNYSFSLMQFQTLQIYCACVAKFFEDFLDEKLEKDMKQLLESRWKAEKVFIEFLIKESLYEQNVSKEALESLREDITNYPFTFLQAFVKTLLMFVYKLRTTDDIKRYEGRDGRCINVFIETSCYYIKIKEMILSQKRTHYLPSLNLTSLLTIPEALLGMLEKNKEIILTEKLEILFGGDWGSVLSMQGRSRFVSYEKSSLTKIKPLGTGVQGNIALVSTKKSPVVFVAKYINPLYFDSQRFIKNEITTLLSLQGNQHIVSLFGFITEDNKEIGFLMEYCRGGSLLGLIDRGKKEYTEKEILFWTAQAASGLCYLHDNNITHRDVKPANMVLNSDHSILKLVDFGIAKIIENTALAAEGFTGTHAFGTYGYNCEEAYTAEAYNPTVDVFSLGRSIWHMIYRVYPTDVTVEETTKAGSLAAPIKGRSYPEVIPISLEVWLFHIGMMVKGKENRPNMEKVYEFFSQKSRETTTEPIDKTEALYSKNDNLAGRLETLELAVSQNTTRIEFKATIISGKWNYKTEVILKEDKASIERMQSKIEALAANQKTTSLKMEMEIGPAASRSLDLAQLESASTIEKQNTSTEESRLEINQGTQKKIAMEKIEIGKENVYCTSKETGRMFTLEDYHTPALKFFQPDNFLVDSTIFAHPMGSFLKKDSTENNKERLFENFSKERKECILLLHKQCGIKINENGMVERFDLPENLKTLSIGVESIPKKLVVDFLQTWKKEKKSLQWLRLASFEKVLNKQVLADELLKDVKTELIWTVTDHNETMFCDTNIEEYKEKLQTKYGFDEYEDPVLLYFGASDDLSRLFSLVVSDYGIQLDFRPNDEKNGLDLLEQTFQNVTEIEDNTWVDKKLFEKIYNEL